MSGPDFKKLIKDYDKLLAAARQTTFFGQPSDTMDHETQLVCWVLHVSNSNGVSDAMIKAGLGESQPDPIGVSVSTGQVAERVLAFDGAGQPAPYAVQKALQHVREHHPCADVVLYNMDTRWTYMSGDSHDDPIKFGEEVDVSILEAAQNSVENFPAVFHFRGAEPEGDPVTCPWCSGSTIRYIDAWAATAAHQSQRIDLEEYQCHGDCGGRSFWV